MLSQKFDRKATVIALGATLTCAALLMIGYSSYQKKQTNEIVQHREWQTNREMGIPIAMDAEPNASPEEKEQARTAALEKTHWGTGENAPARP